MKAAIKALGRRAGYDITRLDTRATMESAIHRLVQKVEVNTVIDVGASDGRWSAMVRRYVPEARFLLIEAQADAHREGLTRIASGSSRIDVVEAAAGDEVGTTHFDASDPFSGVASREATGDHDVVVPMTTVDFEVSTRSLEPPYLLKLDTHGFEEAVLRGADATLRQTSVAVIEAYNFELRPGSMRFHELCTFMEHRGMRVIDLVDVMRRPSDDALWQFDLIFLAANRPEFESNTYA